MRRGANVAMHDKAEVSGWLVSCVLEQFFVLAVIQEVRKIFNELTHAGHCHVSSRGSINICGRISVYG